MSAMTDHLRLDQPLDLEILRSSLFKLKSFDDQATVAKFIARLEVVLAETQLSQNRLMPALRQFLPEGGSSLPPGALSSPTALLTALRFIIGGNIRPFIDELILLRTRQPGQSAAAYVKNLCVVFDGLRRAAGGDIPFPIMLDFVLHGFQKSWPLLYMRLCDFDFESFAQVVEITTVTVARLGGNSMDPHLNAVAQRGQQSRHGRGESADQHSRNRDDREFNRGRGNRDRSDDQRNRDDRDFNRNRGLRESSDQRNRGYDDSAERSFESRGPPSNAAAGFGDQRGGTPGPGSNRRGGSTQRGEPRRATGSNAVPIASGPGQRPTDQTAQARTSQQPSSSTRRVAFRSMLSSVTGLDDTAAAKDHLEPAISPSMLSDGPQSYLGDPDLFSVYVHLEDVTREPAQRHTVVACVDSGATRTTIGQQLAESLGLQIVAPVSPLSTVLANGTSSAVIGTVSVSLPELCAESLVVPVLQGRELLIGQDLVRIGALRVDNRLQVYLSSLADPVLLPLVAGNDSLSIGGELPAAFPDTLLPPSASVTATPASVAWPEEAAVRHMSPEEFVAALPRDLFDEGNQLGCLQGVEHRITLKPDAVPRRARARALPPPVADALRTELERLTLLEVIRRLEDPSYVEWAAPVVMVKKGAGYRMCIDYRYLNSCTVRPDHDDFFPAIMECLASISRLAEFFSKLDLRSGYYQILVHAGSIHLTTFVTPFGYYQCVRLPFGLTTAPNSFNTAMQRILANELERLVLYFDDMLHHSGGPEGLGGHFCSLLPVLKTLYNAGARIHPEKSLFGCKSVRFLGFIVGHGSVKVDPADTVAITEFPAPSSKHGLRRFLGLLNVFRPFIPNLATICAPIAPLTGNVPWSWTDVHQAAFEACKAAAREAMVLSLPDFRTHFILQTDASQTALGAVLLQESSDPSTRVPIRFFSKKLSDVQTRYSAQDLELAAVVFGLQSSAYLIMGSHTVVETDNRNLSILLASPLRDLPGRLARYVLALSEFDFSIRHIAGVTNVAADALSRHVVFRDPSHLLDHISTRQHELPAKFQPSGTTKSGLRVVPSSLVDEVLDYVHGWAHRGAAATLAVIVDLGLYIPRAKQTVADFIKRCTVCSVCKPSPVPVTPAGSIPTGHQPSQIISIDAMGPLPVTASGNCHLIVIVDNFSGYVQLSPTRSVTAQDFADSLCRWCVTFGTPRICLSDNGPGLIASLFRITCARLNIFSLHSSVYRPQGNSKVERANRTIVELLRCTMRDLAQQSANASWDDLVPFVELVLRTTPKSRIGVSPFYMMFGRHPQPPLALCEVFPDAQDVIFRSDTKLGVHIQSHFQSVWDTIARFCNDGRAERKEAGVPLPDEAPFVFLLKPRPGKFDPLFAGPFPVIKASATNVTVRLFDDSTLVVHRSRTRPSFTIPEEATFSEADWDGHFNDFCSNCAYGSDIFPSNLLLLCDSCSRAFHLECLGLSQVPETFVCDLCL